MLDRCQTDSQPKPREAVYSSDLPHLFSHRTFCAEKLESITHGAYTATYDWGTPVLGLPDSVTYGGAGLTSTRTPDTAGRLDKIESTIAHQNNAIISAHDYTLDAAGKRTAAAREDGMHLDYGYNSKGEVTSAVHENAANQELPGRTFGYEFDDIGNRKTATHKALDGAVQSTGYTANGLNQYEIITHPHPLRKLIQGLAHEQADVEVRMHTTPPPVGQTDATGESLIVARIPLGGAPFYSEAAVDATSGATWRYIEVIASRPGAGVNGLPVTAKRQGWMYFPPRNEALLYDLDGNLVEDGRWRYTWDGEPMPDGRAR